MRHELELAIRSVARRARRLTLVYAGSSFGIAAVLLVAAAGVADYCLRYRATEARILASLVVCLGLALACRRWLWPAWQRRPSDIALAQRIERCFPEFRGRLSSALAFLRGADDPSLGSAPLRQAAIEQTTRLMATRDLRACLDPRPARRVLVGLLLLLAAVGGVGVMRPGSTFLALRRLAAPWQPLPWPRRNRLEFVNYPAVLGAGDDFEVELIDRHGRLPELVTIRYRLDPDAADLRVREIRPSDGRLTDRLENVSRSFVMQARGGDDETDWLPIVVREPPRATEVALEVIPPAYAGGRPRQVSKSFRALAGSSVAIRGRADRPVESVVLQHEGATPSAHPLELAADGQSFSLAAAGDRAWELERSGVAWLELMDAEGVIGRESLGEIQVTPDQPPAVEWRSPASAVSAVTPSAVVPLALVIRDDIGVAEVTLQHRRLEEPEEARQSLRVYDASAPLPPGVTVEQERGTAGERLICRFDWRLAEHFRLEPGAELELVVVAKDRRPQTGSSPPRQLQVIAPEEFARRAQQRQAQLLSRLLEALEAQREAQARTTAVALQLDTTQEASPQDADQMQVADFHQRRVSRLLFDEPQGLLAEVTSLTGDLRANPLAAAEGLVKLEQVRAELARLQQAEGPTAQRAVTDALRRLRDAMAPDDEQARDAREAAHIARPLIEDARSAQTGIFTTLEALAATLRQLDDRQRLAAELDRIGREQESLLAETTQRLAGDAFSKPLDELTPSQRGEIRQLAERQRQQGRDLDKLLAAAHDLTKVTPDSAASSLHQALQDIERRAVAEWMRDSGRHLDQNRLGQSLAVQQQILEALGQAAQALASRPPASLDQLRAELEQAATQIQGLSERQRELRAELEAARAAGEEAPERLQAWASGEQQLADEVGRLAGRLANASAPATSASLEGAARHAEDAARAAQQSDSDSSLTRARQAEEELQRAGDRLRQEASRLLSEQLRQQLAAILAEVRDLDLRQLSLQQRWQQHLTDSGTAEAAAASPDQEQLAQEQGELADRTGRAATHLAAGRAYALALDEASQTMRQAVNQMSHPPHVPSVGDSQDLARQRLQLVLESLAAEFAPTAGDSPREGPREGSQEAPSGSVSLPELRLLRTLQEELNQRTARWAADHPDPSLLTADEREELKSLARAQGQLAEFLAQLQLSSPENGPPGDPAPNRTPR